MTRPLFIFSLPRAGSTLLQRILAASGHVETVAEPWVLLPVLSAEDAGLSRAAYDSQVLAIALKEFSERLPGGREKYLEAVREFAMSLYRSAAPSSTKAYFLDKTPSYCLICERIIGLFPDARFIFLHRHPLAVVASIVDTFKGGSFQLAFWENYLTHGLETMMRAQHQAGPRAMALRYEDLVSQPVETGRRLSEYLGIDIPESAFSDFDAVSLEGSMGDPTGIRKYRQLSRESLDRWRGVFANRYRIAYARRYLRWVGRERLSAMGYDHESLLSELEDLDPGLAHLAGDLAGWIYWRASALMGTTPKSIAAAFRQRARPLVRI